MGFVLVLVLLFGGSSGHTYHLIFENGGQLVPGNQVLVAGQPIGGIDDVTLDDNAQAEVTISVDDPLHEVRPSGELVLQRVFAIGSTPDRGDELGGLGHLGHMGDRPHFDRPDDARVVVVATHDHEGGLGRALAQTSSRLGRFGSGQRDVDEEDVRSHLVDDRLRLIERGDVGEDVDVRRPIEDLADPDAEDGAWLDDHEANGFAVGTRLPAASGQGAPPALGRERVRAS